MDLVNPKWMYLKFALFILIGAMCFAVVLIEHPSIKVAACMAVLAWASARTYYFIFYVIEKYIDREYRFSGLLAFIRYLLARRKGRTMPPPRDGGGA